MGGDDGNDGAGERGGDALMSVFLVADTSCGVVLHLATSEDAAQVETSAFIRVCLYQPRLPGCVGTGTETHADTLTRIIVRSLPAPLRPLCLCSVCPLWVGRPP